MTEFEPCPISGKYPVWIEIVIPGGCRGYIEYTDPVTRHILQKHLAGKDIARYWWNVTYLPAARKYAEYLESQKPVEFQVGDVVTLSSEGFHDLCYPNRTILCRESTVLEILPNGLVKLSQAFANAYGPNADPKWLRLISRPKKLTVADLPEIEDCEWRVDHDGPEFKAILNRKGDTLECWAYSTEHEAVEAALDFLNKIWAAKPEGV